MEVELIPFITALLGSFIAGIWDLKTTEIPDEIPYAMIAIALIFYGVLSFVESNYWLLLNSLLVGLCLLGFGFVMYYSGQWGGGDAKILAAIGFLLPSSNLFPQTFFPFPVSFLINVFLIGAAYMILYAFVLSLMNKKILFKFFEDLKSSANFLALGSIFLFVFLIAINYYLINFLQLNLELSVLIKNSLLPIFATLILFLIWKFAKVVEEVGFKKRIPVKKLKVGDVLAESKLWEGITEKELKKIKNSGKKYVEIKEGIRFGLAFPLALIFTYYFGDGLFFLIRTFI